MLARRGGCERRSSAWSRRGAAGHPPLVIIAEGGGFAMCPGDKGVAGALATLVQFAYEAQLLGELERFKACQSCGWCYYDTTKNRSRRWCDMALCGSREKVRAYRARKKAAELS